MRRNLILITVSLILIFSVGCGNAEEGSLSEAKGSEPRRTKMTETELCFNDVSGRTFLFSSGAGGWYTELSINGDGSFEGVYQDGDFGSATEEHPYGTIYYCEFSGTFGDLERVDKYTYKMKLDSIEFARTPEEREIKDGVLYVYSTAYGLDDGGEFYLYLPGINMYDLPIGYLSWILRYGSEVGELPFYGLYNINTEEGFSSYVYEEQTARSTALYISFTEERGAELETKLQQDTTQSDMEEAAEELFQVWDDSLNFVWRMLKSELDAAAMEALRTEEREWIASKEAEVKAAGQEYGDGDMRSVAESMKAAELTKERVYELHIVAVVKFLSTLRRK